MRCASQGPYASWDGPGARSVEAWIAWEEGQPSQAAALTDEDPLPQLVHVGQEGVVEHGVHHDPRALSELVLELAWAPTRVAGEEPSRCEVMRQLARVDLEVKQADLTEHGQEAGAVDPWCQPRQTPATVLFHRAAHVEHGGRGHQVRPRGQRVADGQIGGSVEHETHRTLVGVLDHEHDRTIEVRVAEHRFSQQETTNGGGHGTSLAPSLPPGAYREGMLEDGTYDVIVIDSEQDGDTVRLELTILGGPHKGEVVSTLASGSPIDVIDALGMPGTLTVRDGEPSVVLDQ